MLNSKKLLGRMAEKGYSQSRLAKAIGISDNTMTSRMKSRSAFNTDEIDSICDALEITNSLDKIDIFLWHPSQSRDECIMV